MRVAIMQPYIFPYIGYFQLINTADRFIIYDDVNFINRGWINRNNILVSGNAALFSVPLIGASQNKKIKDILVEDKSKWAGKFLKSVLYNYKKAPYFESVFALIESVFHSSFPESVSELNLRGIKAVCEYLQINTELIPSSSVFNNEELKGQYRILDICKQAGADHYINPPGGASLYSKELFEKENIKLNFIKTGLVEYKQFSAPFVPNLSIIDVLMFNSKEDTAEKLMQFDLI